MPGRYRVKPYLENAYYHIYNRGVNKQRVFIEQSDYVVFINLLKRYLSESTPPDRFNRIYDSLHLEIDLLAFCLMPNHYHLLIYQTQLDGMTKLLRRVATSYASYFNKKYSRVGPLFQDRFKASLVKNDAYLDHITRYIHLNPADYQAWEFSSLPYYLSLRTATWINPKPILSKFTDPTAYKQFLDDYMQERHLKDSIKPMLADG